MGLFLREDTPAPAPLPVRDNRAKPAAYNAARPITASAERIQLTQQNMLENRPYAAWQAEAWMAYERIGEIHSGFGLVSNLLSRVRIFPGVIGDQNTAPTNVNEYSGRDIKKDLKEAALAAVAELTNTDFSSMVRKFILNMHVPGECYLVKMPTVDDPEQQSWTICSTDEVKLSVGGWQYQPLRGSSSNARVLPAGTFIARIWRQNPRFSLEPESSMGSIAESVETLLMVERIFRGTMRSRMNAGVLFLPDGLTPSTGQTAAEQVIEEPDVDPVTALATAAQVDPGNQILAEMMTAMTTPIADEANAANVVPFLLTGPEQLGAAIKHVTFDRHFDDVLLKKGAEALDRILQGLDIPKEIIQGMTAIKYTNAVIIDENLYKSNLEPSALMMVDALTLVYLRPILRAQGFADEDVNKLCIWYDPSEIITRPNSTEAATTGLDRMALSPRAWRREHGFNEDDAPSPDDLAHMLLATKVLQIPDTVLMRLLENALPGILKPEDLVLPNRPDNSNGPPGASNGDVLPFPKGVPAGQKLSNVPPDPQRVAAKQVGLDT